MFVCVHLHVYVCVCVHLYVCACVCVITAGWRTRNIIKFVCGLTTSKYFMNLCRGYVASTCEGVVISIFGHCHLLITLFKNFNTSTSQIQ